MKWRLIGATTLPSIFKSIFSMIFLEFDLQSHHSRVGVCYSTMYPVAFQLMFCFIEYEQRYFSVEKRNSPHSFTKNTGSLEIRAENEVNKNGWFFKWF